MGAFAVGDVVLVLFPYADFSHYKKRPALVVGQAEFDNFILCQITSRAGTGKRAIPLKDQDFKEGTLHLDSYIRFDKLFTVEQSVLDKRVGRLEAQKFRGVQAQIREIFR